MECALCWTSIDLWDLDSEGVVGMPAHESCAEAERQAIRDALDEANRAVVAWHERHPRRTAA